jgi:hypothetical protein
MRNAIWKWPFTGPFSLRAFFLLPLWEKVARSAG